jgi:CO dehydrogenase/acetyl-CoA synthase epsilon subunit
MDHRDSWRPMIRRELRLAPRCRRSATLVRVASATALLWALGSSAIEAQAPYRQELIPRFSSLSVGSRSSPVFVDLDGDGDLDAVVGEYFGSLRYFENTGDTSTPAFAEATGTANPFAGIDVGYDSNPDLVDLDGDGDLDLVVGGFYGSLRYFENTGDASTPAFAEATGTANPFDGIDVGSLSSPDLVDLDGDGDLDAVVGERFGSLRYFENTGGTSSPAFAEATFTANPFASIGVGYFSSPNLVDLDGDGDLDLVVGELYGSLRYYENTGDTSSPAFAEATGTANPFAGIVFDDRIVEFNSSPALVDLDGDGDLDAVVGENGGSLRYFENTGDTSSPAFGATGTASPLASIDVGDYSSPDLVDLDGDGDLDAVVGESYGSLQYFENTGDTSSPAFAEVTGTANPFADIDVGDQSSPDLVDLDGDGDLDLVVGELHGSLRYYENTGDTSTPAFAEATLTANPFAGIGVGSWTSPDLVDLDGDGDFDAVVGENSGNLRYFENTGDTSTPAFAEATGTANPFAGIDVGLSTAARNSSIWTGTGTSTQWSGTYYGRLRYYENTGNTSSPAFVEAASGRRIRSPGSTSAISAAPTSSIWTGTGTSTR